MWKETGSLAWCIPHIIIIIPVNSIPDDVNLFSNFIIGISLFSMVFPIESTVNKSSNSFFISLIKLMYSV